jgi:hypothetical protein
MAKQSVAQPARYGAASQVRRRWQRAFQERMRDLPPSEWRCVGIDIGKYEHVAVISDGTGTLLTEPLRFTILRCDFDAFFVWVDQWRPANPQALLIGMEPTGHYYEQMAYEASQRYGREQVYLIQATDVARRRGEWNQGTFKNDPVDGCIISELLRTGQGRPYRPEAGVYLSLHYLERCRLNREKASTRVKNHIVGHVDRLLPGLVISDPHLAERCRPLFDDLWTQATPRRLLEVCPDPYTLRELSPETLYGLFTAASLWMNRPYAAKILQAVRQLCLPDRDLAQQSVRFLRQDLALLTYIEQQRHELETEMCDLLPQTWGRWLLPSGVDPLRLACLVATTGDLRQYASARQLFARSGLHPGCHDSGTQQRRGQGQHIVKPGDRHLRRQLLRFTYCMVARYPTLQRYKQQLLQRSKSPVAAQIAVARKLTGIIYALATQEVPFDPQRLA